MAVGCDLGYCDGRVPECLFFVGVEVSNNCVEHRLTDGRQPQRSSSSFGS